MAIPVISNTTSVLGYRKGQYFEYQMQATNTPTSWTANGLPSGMADLHPDMPPGARPRAGHRAQPGKRAKWAKQLTDDEAKAYTVEKILAGADGWNPAR